MIGILYCIIIFSVIHDPPMDTCIKPILFLNIMLIPNCTSGKDVYILATDTPAYTLNRGSVTVGPITWFNPPKPGLQSRALCCTVCALSIDIVLY